MSLRLKNISKSFEDKKVLSNFSYDFDDVGIYAITGASGVGKTTLLRIILGIDKKFNGEITGEEKESISVVFQEHRLFPNLTALENLTEIVFQNPSADDFSAAKSLLRKLGFTDSEMQLYPASLSGGMKQRVSIARGLLQNAKILLLDEPTKELDATLVKTVLDEISLRAESSLVIIVTHNENDIKYLGAKTIELKTI